MAFFLILFILTCVYFFVRSVGRIVGWWSAKPKTFTVQKREPETYIPEEVKAEPQPQVINIQNNTTQIIIVN